MEDEALSQTVQKTETEASKEDIQLPTIVLHPPPTFVEPDVSEEIFTNSLTDLFVNTLSPIKEQPDEGADMVVEKVEVIYSAGNQGVSGDVANKEVKDDVEGKDSETPIEIGDQDQGISHKVDGSPTENSEVEKCNEIAVEVEEQTPKVAAHENDENPGISPMNEPAEKSETNEEEKCDAEKESPPKVEIENADTQEKEEIKEVDEQNPVPSEHSSLVEKEASEENSSETMCIEIPKIMVEGPADVLIPQPKKEDNSKPPIEDSIEKIAEKETSKAPDEDQASVKIVEDNIQESSVESSAPQPTEEETAEMTDTEKEV